MNITAGNPHVFFYTRDVTAYSQFWLVGGEINSKGSKNDDLLSQLNLSKIISEIAYLLKQAKTSSRENLFA